MCDMLACLAGWRRDILAAGEMKEKEVKVWRYPERSDVWERAKGDRPCVD